MASENEKFNLFWGSAQGQEIIQYVQSACLPECNEDLANFILWQLYHNDVRQMEGVREFMLNCQKSIQRALATL